MADEREPMGRARPSEGGAARGALGSVLLVGAVLAILATSFILKSDAPRERVVDASPALRPVRPPIEEPPPAAAPAPTPTPTRAAAAATPAPRAASPDALGKRAVDDVTRLGRAHGRYTAQLVVACRPETVERLLDSTRPGDPIYILPAQVGGEACFRVCWGSYASPTEAAASADRPAALRSAPPRAVEIVKVLP